MAWEQIPHLITGKLYGDTSSYSSANRVGDIDIWWGIVIKQIKASNEQLRGRRHKTHKRPCDVIVVKMLISIRWFHEYFRRWEHLNFNMTEIQFYSTDRITSDLYPIAKSIMTNLPTLYIDGLVQERLWYL